MISQLNQAARAATARAAVKWTLVHGLPPGATDGHLLAIIPAETGGRPIAIGCGTTELEACNALLADLTERLRGLLSIRRMVKVWRTRLRAEAGELRAEKSAAFLASRR